MDRTAIFIDGGYLDQLLKHEFGGVSVDYRKLTERLGDGCDVLRT